MKKALIVIDMQHDFVDGALGSPDAIKIVPSVKKRIQEYQDANDIVIFTQDTHHDDYMETNEGKHLPVPLFVWNKWMGNRRRTSRCKQARNS
jgi:nicotinamidase-related amidase